MKTTSLEATILFTASVALFATGHWIGGTVLLGAFAAACMELAK